MAFFTVQMISGCKSMGLPFRGFGEEYNLWLMDDPTYNQIEPQICHRNDEN